MSTDWYMPWDENPPRLIRPCSIVREGERTMPTEEEINQIVTSVIEQAEHGELSFVPPRTAEADKERTR